MLISVGALLAILSGAGLPFMSILQGSVAQHFIQAETIYHNDTLFNQGCNDTADTKCFDMDNFHRKVLDVCRNYGILASVMFLTSMLQSVLKKNLLQSYCRLHVS
jgi:hypothetical protein